MNPELLRNLWLEFSLRRLVLLPVVLILIFAAPFNTDGAAPVWKGEVSRAAFNIVFGLLALLWGTRLAGEVMLAEIMGRTWDGQRSSVIGPCGRPI